MTDAAQPLPDVVVVTRAFTRRLPPQRLVDMLKRFEPGVALGELTGEQPFRIIAFGALLRDHPGRDEASLWLHSYDVAVEVVDEDPTSGNGLTPLPLFAPTTS
jgi:hypothetical protein